MFGTRSAVHQITRSLTEYARAMDTKDDALGLSVFAIDATVDYGDLYRGSARGFIEVAHHIHDGLAATTHLISNLEVTLRPRSATSTCRVYVVHVRQDEIVPRLRTVFGTYTDQWEVREGIWRIRTRTYSRQIEFLTDAAVTV